MAGTIKQYPKCVIPDAIFRTNNIKPLYSGEQLSIASDNSNNVIGLTDDGIDISNSDGNVQITASENVILDGTDVVLTNQTTLDPLATNAQGEVIQGA
jgi:hypothetical protein